MLYGDVPASTVGETHSNNLELCLNINHNITVNFDGEWHRFFIAEGLMEQEIPTVK